MENLETLDNMFSNNYNKPFYKRDDDDKDEKKKTSKKGTEKGTDNKETDNKKESDITKTNTEINTTIAAQKQNPCPIPILDPLSVIIKLAILSNKSVGTKILIKDNIVHIQEPGIFHGISRYINKTNRNDLQYLYNPIQLACQQFLNKEYRNKTPQIVDLFICAQKGIIKLIDTYQGNSIIILCLNYYYALIDNYVKQHYLSIFRDDELTKLYKEPLVFQLNSVWTSDKIKMILDIIRFLNDDTMANDNVKSLDVFIQNIDKITQGILLLHV
jgi:hypothetical protein